MEINQAVKILDQHQKWRRDNEGEMLNPKDIGIAINVILNYFKNKEVLKEKPKQRPSKFKVWKNEYSDESIDWITFNEKYHWCSNCNDYVEGNCICYTR